MAIPSVELLDATHDFPGPYVFKAIGPSTDSFTAQVSSAVRSVTGKDPTFARRETPGGKYVALTIDIVVENSKSVVQIYENILNIDQLVLLL